MRIGRQVIIAKPDQVKYASGSQRLDMMSANKNLVVVYSRRENKSAPFGDIDAFALNYGGELDNDDMMAAIAGLRREIDGRERGAKSFNECYIAHCEARMGGRESVKRRLAFRDLVARILETNPLTYEHNRWVLRFKVDKCDFVERTKPKANDGVYATWS